MRNKTVGKPDNDGEKRKRRTTERTKSSKEKRDIDTTAKIEYRWEKLEGKKKNH